LFLPIIYFAVGRIARNILRKLAIEVIYGQVIFLQSFATMKIQLVANSNQLNYSCKVYSNVVQLHYMNLKGAVIMYNLVAGAMQKRSGGASLSTVIFEFSKV